MSKKNEVLIIGTTCVDSDTVSSIMHNVLEENADDTHFTCVGYSAKDYKTTTNNIESIGIKDPFSTIIYRFIRRLYLIINKDNYSLTTKYLVKKLKRLLAGRKYDLVVSCSGRFCHTNAAYVYAKRYATPLRIVYFDSFIDNPYTRSKKTRLKKEIEWFTYADSVLVNAEAQNKLYEHEVEKAKLFKIPIRIQDGDGGDKNTNCRNYLYGGLFYKNIREPSSIIAFADTLTNKGEKILCFSNAEFDHPQIVSSGLISHDDYVKECNKAKALIYIGNIGTDVKSSKFLEYIAMRKPIIGIQVSKDDEVRKYPFYYDWDIDNLPERIQSIKPEALSNYNPKYDFSDRSFSALYKQIFG